MIQMRARWSLRAARRQLAKSRACRRSAAPGAKQLSEAGAGRRIGRRDGWIGLGDLSLGDLSLGDLSLGDLILSHLGLDGIADAALQRLGAHRPRRREQEAL